MSAMHPHRDGERIEEDPPWSPWTPDEVAALLSGVKARWYVVAGWALDLFRGQQTRAHEDIEIGVASSDFMELRTALGEYDFEVVGSVEGGDGMRWPLDSAAFDEHFQTWVREPVTGLYRLDIFRDPHDDDAWICRRHTSIRLPYDQVIKLSSTGIPYMSPEIVLLFKAKPNRDKDRNDFDGVRSFLSDGQLDWLRLNLNRIHPNHPWLKVL